MQSTPLTIFAALTCATLAPSLATAGVVFSDTFSDSDRAGWFNSSGVSNTATVADGALTVTSGRHVLAYFADTTLSSVGDTLTLAFDVSVLNPLNAGSGFRVGFFDKNGSTAVSADGVNTGFGNYLGYTAALNLVPPGSPVIFRQRDNPGNTALITTNTNYTQLGSAGGPVASFVSGTTYRFIYTLEKTGADALSIGVSVTGGAFGETYQHSVPDESGIVSLLNSFAISSTTTTATSFTLDNVSVTFTPVPEPSSFAAWSGVAVLGLVASRRRRR
ncbi:MAG: MYXO-CTERM sorting domain-containing protein [Opitutaceae bacterium]|jgi:hypothetical protein|nr:MYXO-CTERM sorting domain-containing protein [Opitutaceae bacterium]